jgi:hypothetical protein
MFVTQCVQKIKTHFVINKFFNENRAFYEIIWKKKYGAAGQAADENRTRRMRLASWITEDTNTHSQYVILSAFPQQQWLHERASVLRCTYSVCLVMLLMSL